MNEFVFKLMLFFLLLVNSSMALGKKETCYKIDILDIKGARKIAFQRLQRLKTQYEHKCINIKDIKEIVRVITNEYIQDGYVTSRVYIPEQNLQERKLIIQVREGIIEDIEFPVDGSIKYNNLGLIKGRVFNLRDIEQSIDNINRLKSSNVNFHLKPGKKEGSSIIVVNNKPSKKWYISSGIDNSGSKSKGYNQSYSSFTLENALGLNEYYTFGYRFSLRDGSKTNNMKSYTGVILIPFGYNNFTISYNKASYKNTIIAARKNYQNKGGSKVAKASVNRVVHRDNNSKTYVNLGIGFDDYSNYLAENKIELSTYNLRKFDVGISYQRRFDASSIVLGMQYTGGKRQAYSANFAKLAVPDRHFNKINYNFFWHKPLPVKIRDKNIAYNLQINGQLSPDLLVISEKDTVGGLSSVRGFKDYSENSDNTLVFRNELAVDIAYFEQQRIKSLLGNISVFGAFDFGMFKNREESGLRSGALSGIAAGIKNRGGHVNFSMIVAKPLEARNLLKKAAVVYFNLSVDV